MRVSIVFNVYGDFYKLTSKQDAIKVLNKQLDYLISHNKLTILYERKKVKIQWPLKLQNTGEIYDDVVPYWSNIQLNINLSCEKEEFKEQKLIVSTCPNNFLYIKKIW